MRGIFGSIVMAGALVIAGCSSDPSSNADSASKHAAKPEVTATTTPATTTSDATALCAIFTQLAANGAGRDAQFSATTPDGWQKRIATTAEMAAVAPPEWRDEAETYHQMMEDRAELAADHGIVGVNDLPTDVRNAFISSHAAMQADINRFIAFMGQTCGNRTS